MFGAGLQFNLRAVGAGGQGQQNVFNDVGYGQALARKYLVVFQQHGEVGYLLQEMIDLFALLLNVFRCRLLVSLWVHQRAQYGKLLAHFAAHQCQQVVLPLGLRRNGGLDVLRRVR